MLKPAKDIVGCFKKKGGEYAYIKVSDNSVRFLELDPDFIYGICFNGNMTRVDRETLVEEVQISEVMENVATRDEWNATFAKPEAEK